MEIVLDSVAFAIAVVCASLMGFAIQRGSTCTVDAVDEVVMHGSFGRLMSLLEAALWVGGGLLLAQVLHALPKMPLGYPVSAWTFVGGALLGLGAFVTRACVFGAIARLGSGEWAYIVTPFGFYVGCISVGRVFGLVAPQRLLYGSPILQASAWVGVLFPAFVTWRITKSLFDLRSDPTGPARWRDALARHVWSPHVATTIIGIAFLVMLLVVGSWTYTDVLVELARGMASSFGARSLLVVALLLGALLGGWTAGRFRSTRVSAVQLLRCFGGGVLMGWGSLLTPGGNDGLILVGMPLAWPYAWLAVATMCVTIAAARLAVIGAQLRPRS